MLSRRGSVASVKMCCSANPREHTLNVAIITRMTFSFTAALAISVRRGIISYFLRVNVSDQTRANEWEHALVQLLGYLLIECEEPETETNLVAHLGARVMPQDIYKAVGKSDRVRARCCATLPRNHRWTSPHCPSALRTRQDSFKTLYSDVALVT